MNKKILLILISVISCVLFCCCDNFDGNQEIPSYIKVKGFNVVSNPSFSYEQSEGFLTNNITDVWVYCDNIFVGAYSLPKSDNDSLIIPILKEGRHLIELRPGIKWNGMSSTREYYRFYTTAQDTINLIQGQVVTIEKQNIMYNSYATFALVDMFEDTYLHFENAPTTDSTITSSLIHIISNDSVRYGNHCGAMYMGSNSNSYKIISKDSISCSNTSAMILELDYHCNIPFEVGIYGAASSSSAYKYISAMRLNANNDKGWQKIYIILGKVWGYLSYKPFKLYFEPKNPNNVSNGFVHIDNIKIVHYPASK